MSFQPLQPGFGESLLGTAEPTRFIDIAGENTNRPLFEQGFGGGSAKPSQDYFNTISLILISAFIFVTVIAIYDVIRNIIKNYYAELALTDPRSKINSDDIIRTEIANQESLYASLFFAGVALLSAIVFIGFILFVLSNRS